MSVWNKVKKEDIEIDGDEINCRFDYDKLGNHYVVIKKSDMIDILLKELPNDGELGSIGCFRFMSNGRCYNGYFK